MGTRNKSSSFSSVSLGMTEAYGGASYLSVQFPIEEEESFT